MYLLVGRTVLFVMVLLNPKYLFKKEARHGSVWDQ